MRKSDNGENELKIEWTPAAAGASTLEVILDGDSTTMPAATDTTHTFPNLIPGSSHVVKLKATAGSPCTGIAETADTTLYVPYNLQYEMVQATENSLSFNIFIDDTATKLFTIANAPTYNSGADTAVLSPAAGGSEQSSFEVSVASGLTPLTKYTFTIGGIAAGTGLTEGIVATQDLSVCSG